jgi:hypothetical protein
VRTACPIISTAYSKNATDFIITKNSGSKSLKLQSRSLQNCNPLQENARKTPFFFHFLAFSRKFTCNQSQFIVILPMSILKK